MTRKTSAYARKRAKQPQLLNKAYAEAHHTASFLATMRMCRPYQADDVMPGDIEGAPSVQAVATKAMLQVHSALDGLLNCQPPEDPYLDFSRLKHALAVSAIRTLQMIYGHKKQVTFDPINLADLSPDQEHAVQLIFDANQALNRAYDRFEAGKGYGLDGEGRSKLPEAVELYEVILLNSTPEQMSHAHSEALKVQGKSEVVA